jgi:hypothetical protein
MFPRFGYTTAAWDPPKAPGRKLDRIGKVEVIALGGFSTREATQTAQNFAGIGNLTAAYYEAGQGELLLRNSGGVEGGLEGYGFAVCTRCGFAMAGSFKDATPPTCAAPRWPGSPRACIRPRPRSCRHMYYYVVNVAAIALWTPLLLSLVPS